MDPYYKQIQEQMIEYGGIPFIHKEQEMKPDEKYMKLMEQNKKLKGKGKSLQSLLITRFKDCTSFEEPPEPDEAMLHIRKIVREVCNKKDNTSVKETPGERQKRLHKEKMNRNTNYTMRYHLRKEMLT